MAFTLACPHCDQLIRVSPLRAAQQAHCPTCHCVVDKGPQQNNDTIVALSIAAIVFLLSALFYPFISFSNQGLNQTISLLDAAKILIQFDSLLLGILLDLTIIALPFFLLSLYIPLHMGLLSIMPKHWGIILLKLIRHLRPWVMCEIFLIGVLISMIKIMAMADVAFGLSFWSFLAFVICYLYVSSKVNEAALWQQVPGTIHPLPVESSINRAKDANLRLCNTCFLLTDQRQCPRCNSKVRVRTKNNIENVVALSVCSLILYIPANVLPIMHTWVFNQNEPSTILAGVATLWQIGSYPIAIIIFIASIIIPIAKLMVLFWLCYIAKNTKFYNQHQANRLYLITEFIGRWSMIDVFVVTILVALVQLGALMSITPGVGAIFFAGMVITSMLAAIIFDPRLVWDKQRDIE